MALLKDEVSYIAALIAVILVAQGYYLADPLASAIVAAIIAISGVYLLKDNVQYLVAERQTKSSLKKWSQ